MLSGIGVREAAQLARHVNCAIDIGEDASVSCVTVWRDYFNRYGYIFIQRLELNPVDHQ